MADSGYARPTQTAAAYQIPIANSNGKIPNAWLLTGTGNGLDADTVDGAHASATPTADTIPIASGAGKLAAGWGGSASTLATLNSSSKVVEDPANATATPTASKIPIADGSGKLASGWGGSASTLATLDSSSRLVGAGVVVSSIQVVGAQGAAVADATGAGDVVAQLNALLARLRTHGLIAT